MGRPHSPAAAGLARLPERPYFREVLEFGSPIPLSFEQRGYDSLSHDVSHRRKLGSRGRSLHRNGDA